MFCKFQLTAARRRLVSFYRPALRHGCFNSQPREGGWLNRFDERIDLDVSTHSRAKAAGADYNAMRGVVYVSTHSRAKAAG